MKLLIMVMIPVYFRMQSMGARVAARVRNFLGKLVIAYHGFPLWDE
jgi:hypothetical protein